ncbi:MAG TPA: hypothetical protein VN516_00550 [Candidatus Baltobacteraceae bacterium]|nr:hypothetical protein [Candidatus Baltobacteraceae bacterium]HXS68599.1 hypothetical protein [Candidatus Polarisedimenticolia bacterium]
MTTTSHGFAIFSQLAAVFPTLLVCIAAFVFCFLRWKQAPRAALFCAIGFGLLTLNAIIGVFGYALVLNGNLGNHSNLVAFQVLSVFRLLINIAALIFLLIAVFSDRQPKSVSSPFESSANQPPAE